MKKTFIYLVLPLMTALFFIACSKDDSDSDNTSETMITVPLQVTIVFEPGELGDRGTNDRLLGELADFAATHKDKATTQFISMPTDAATTKAVRDWAAATYDATTHEHRLLVLTSPSQVSLLSGLQMRETDRVLMLCTPLADAKKSGPTGRTHVLNVSLADGVNRFIDRWYFWFNQYRELFDPEDIHDGPFRILHKNSVNYADSIVEAVQKRFPSLRTGDEDGIWTSNLNVVDGDLQQFTYAIAGMLDNYAEYEGFTDNALIQSLTIASFGIGNQSFDYYFFTHGSERNLLVGERTNVDSNCDYVAPRYPLKAWLDAWAANPDAQPEEEWHGAWDGCAVFLPAKGY
jgi:hypothetical protein